MKPQQAVQPERSKQNASQPNGQAENPDLAKLYRLLWKLNPIYMASKRPNMFQRLVHGLAAVVVMLGSLVNTPLFASDYVLPPDQYVGPAAVSPSQLAAATAVTSPTVSPTDSFFNLGPLSTPTAADVTATAAGPTYYVSNSGSDQADGSAANPWKSFQHAVSKLKAGDTLTIKEGTYNVTQGTNFAVSGRSDAYITIQGEGNVVIDGTNLYAYTPVFDTKGNDYLRFKNLTVNNARDAVEVSPGSSFVEIDGLKTDGNDFAVKINGAENVIVRNVYAVNSRNAFRTEGSGTRNILFENIETYGSKDIYPGYDLNYTNGDGFILETGTNITLRNIISADHWDAGFDIKASNVLVENVVAYGNKNNFKTWGSNITIKSSLSYNAKRQPKPDGTTVDGNGINVRQGSVKLVNITFVDNQDDDLKINTGATVQLQNSVVARRLSNGAMLFDEGGTFTEDNNIWFWQGRNQNMSLSPNSKWVDPRFVDWSKLNFRLSSTSPAIGMGNSSFSLSPFDLDGNVRVGDSQVESGAYEFYGTTPNPTPTPTPSPSPTPSPNACTTAMCGVTAGQTVSGVVKIQPNLTLNPDIRKISYYLNGTLSGREYAAPFMWGGSAGFDTKKLADGTYTLTGAYTTNSGDKSFSLTFTVNNTNPVPVPSPTPTPTPTPSPTPVPGTCTTAMCGVTNGQTVGGVIKVQPNLTLNPDVRKVSYYLNGTLSSREYSSPFTWGGTEGFDTKKLANGTYTLTGAYTTKTGDKSFTITFTVNNSPAPAPSPSPSPAVCTTAICGVVNSQVLSGIVTIQPNLTLNPGIRKVAYYINGTLSTREYSSPFKWGGSAGFDTRTLANGTYTLSGVYTTAAGDVPFSFTVTIRN